MAKKHSSKTATEKAMSASEPRLQTFSGWQGVSFAQAPLGWEPNEPIGANNSNQQDLKPNFFHVQNNLITTDNLAVETRMDSEVIGEAPWIDENDHDQGKYEFTGVACIYHRWLFCVVRLKGDTEDSFKDRIAFRDINDSDPSSWTIITLYDAEGSPHEKWGYEIAEIGYFETQLIATVRHEKDDGNNSQDDNASIDYEGEIFTAYLNYSKVFSTDRDGIKVASDSLVIEADSTRNQSQKIYNRMESVPAVPDPGNRLPSITKQGTNTKFLIWEQENQNAEAMVEFSYSYVNKFGSTIASETKTIWASTGPQNWNAAQYVKIGANFPSTTFVDTYKVTGVDVYVTVEGYQTKSFAAHVDVKPGATKWSAPWLGGLQDVSQWTNVQLEEPKENTTKGVKAAHFANHDSRLYFWGDPEFPYRLYIGGNPGSELSVARGLGGAFVDIEPGTGLEVMGTAKWKTSSGANIITIMCGNPNTNMIKRFNLVETNLTITNEVSSKGYMYEEVSNVVGCNSRWGYGVFGDGLYALNRYGLLLTTMAMEYNNQMRTQNVAEVIKPLFTERIGNRLDDARLVCIDDVIYILLSEERNHPGEPTILDQVILCYDLDAKAWYTFTSDEVIGRGSDELILHAMSIDSQEHAEGLGLITKDTVILYPNTGIQEQTAPEFDIMLETGELMGKQPKQMTLYLCQLEFRFDYFIGTAIAEIEGIDYYGRPVVVHKEFNSRIDPGPNYNGDVATPDEDDIVRNSGTLRDYTEWVRVDKLMESYRLRIKGKARFRLNNINAKVYVQDDKIGLPYGFDSHSYYQNRHDSTNDDHHWIQDYNNLRRTLLT